MIENRALWLPAKRADFATGPAPMPQPGSGQLVVRVRAVAVNPFERLIRTVGDLITPWLAYPLVAGSDLAGEVVAIGPGVTRFGIGDRVLGFASGSEKAHASAAEGAFQHHVLLNERVTAPLPPTLSFEAACVLPLALTTAGAALFQPDFLALSPPARSTMSAGKTLLVWGGSTSVGCNAIQLAVAAGYDVIATASPHNADMLKRLGARQTLDYRSPTIVRDLIAALAGREAAGAVAIGPGSARACIQVLGRSWGNRFVAKVTPPASFDGVPAGRGRRRKLAPAVARMVTGNLALALLARRNGVRTKFVWGGAPADNAIGPMIFRDFLPDALAEGRYVAAPEPLVAGEGLEAIPAALERQRAGVSGRKVVVRI